MQKNVSGIVYVHGTAFAANELDEAHYVGRHAARCKWQELVKYSPELKPIN